MQGEIIHAPCTGYSNHNLALPYRFESSLTRSLVPLLLFWRAALPAHQQLGGKKDDDEEQRKHFVGGMDGRGGGSGMEVLGPPPDDDGKRFEEP